MIASAEAMTLRELPLFAELSDDDLERISEHVRRTTVPAGTLLISAMLPAEAVYFILEGSVRVQLLSEEGNEITTAILGPGDSVGEMGMFTRRRSAVNVVTRQECTLLWMERKAFHACLDANPHLNRNLVRVFCARLRASTERNQALATLDVTGRVAQQLLELAERFGKPIPGEGIHIAIPITQGEVADLIAATRERVNHIMVRLKRSGIFTVDSEHRITLHRPEVLAELSRY